MKMIIWPFFLYFTLTSAQDTPFTSKPLWELTSKTPKLYTSRVLTKTESVTHPTLTRAGRIENNHFPNGNKFRSAIDSITNAPKLYTSKVLSTSKVFPTTESITALYDVATSRELSLNTITVPSTTKKTRPPKKVISTFSSQTPYQITTSRSTTVPRNEYVNRQNNIVYRRNKNTPQNVVPSNEGIVYYDNANPVMPTNNNNEIYTKYQDNTVYNVEPSQKYRFNVRTRSGTQSFDFNTGGASQSVINPGRLSTKMVRDGNNYKLIVYV